MQSAGVANFAMDNVDRAYGGTSDKLARMRKQSRDGDTVRNEFTEEERKQME